MKLDNVRLLVTNFDDFCTFYQEILPWIDTDMDETGGNYASFEMGKGKVLALFKKKLMAVAVGTEDLTKQTEAQDRFACIFEVTDLEQTVHGIEERGGCEFRIKFDNL